MLSFVIRFCSFCFANSIYLFIFSFPLGPSAVAISVDGIV